MSNGFYDVELPDGTLIEGVPEGTTKAQLISKLSKNGMDVSGLTRTQKQATPAPQDVMQPQKTKTSRFKALADTYAQGATFGLGDELSAGLATALSYPTYAALGIEEDKGLKERYQDFLGSQRQDIQQAREDYPAQSFATEMLGAVGTGGGLAKGAAKLAPKAALAAKTFAAANPLKAAAATAAATGGAYGFGTGEGGLAQRAKTAGISAGISAPLGPLGSKLARGITSKLAGKGAKAGTKEFDDLTGSEKLRKQAGKLYKLASKKGGRLKAGPTQKLLQQIEETTAPQSNVELTLRGQNKIAASLDTLKKQLADGADFEDLRSLEVTLGEMANDNVVAATGKLNAAGNTLKNAQQAVKKFIDKVSDDDVIGGKAAFALKRKADQKWKQSLKLNEVEKVVTRAQLQEQPSTGLRSGLRTFLANPKRTRSFSKEELKLMRKAAELDPITGALRMAGSRLAPLAASSAGFGAYGADPVTLAILGGAYGVSALARKGADTRQLAKINALQQLVSGAQKVKPTVDPALIFKPAFQAGAYTGMAQGE